MVELVPEYNLLQTQCPSLLLAAAVVMHTQEVVVEQTARREYASTVVVLHVVEMEAHNQLLAQEVLVHEEMVQQDPGAMAAGGTQARLHSIPAVLDSGTVVPAVQILVIPGAVVVEAGIGAAVKVVAIAMALVTKSYNFV